MEHTLTAKAKQLDKLLPVQYRTYYHEVANTPDGSRKECLVFANVAVAATSFLRASIEHTAFALDNAEILLEDTVNGHEALKETLDSMEEHNRSNKALYEALGQWMKEEQTRIDITRADMEDAVEKQSATRVKSPPPFGRDTASRSNTDHQFGCLFNLQASSPRPFSVSISNKAPLSTVNTPPISVEFSQFLSLNTALSTGYRTPFPNAGSTHVIQQAIQSLKGSRIANTVQAKEIGELKKELIELKEKQMVGMANTDADTDMDMYMGTATPLKAAPIKSSDIKTPQTQALQTLTLERTDYQFCIMQLIMYITGEGSEARPAINFAKLREVLEAAREGGWTLKRLAEGIEGVAPADQEVVWRRKERWEGLGRG